MSIVIPAILKAAESLPIPEPAIRAGADLLVWDTERRLRQPGRESLGAFVAEMDAAPIARATDAANDQHYELPPEFFALILGARRKYSCGYYDDSKGPVTLDDAEEAALTESARLADIVDGQSILELGCGWGSFSLFLAERFSRSTITAVSNAANQRAHIEAEARRRGLTNLRVVTHDINTFAPDAPVDRIVSIEMFEHIANWSALLRRMHGWLRPGGRVYLHFFSHVDVPYRFNHDDPNDWIAQHFFTGGMMPCHDMPMLLDIPFEVEAQTRWSGTHYARTARDWRRQFEARRPEVLAALGPVYGADLPVWIRRWRLFLIATERLFGFRDGRLWGISHYRLRPTGGDAVDVAGNPAGGAKP